MNVNRSLVLAAFVALVAVSGARELPSEQQSRKLLAANGLFDRLENILGEGADLTKKLAKGLEHGLQRGAGGMGFAGDKVTDALSTVTDKASEAGHKFVDLLKSPFRRGGQQYVPGRAAPKLNQESGRAVGDWSDAQGSDSVPNVYSEDDTEAVDPTQASKIKSEEKQALQKAMAAERSAKRAAKEAARAMERAEHASGRHLPHGAKKSAFTTDEPVPTAGKVPSGKHMTYSQAKRAALKAARKQRVHTL